MNLQTIFVSVLLIFSLNLLHSQSDSSYQVLDDNTGYSAAIIENFHLHLNKTSFIRGERIWFKAYVYDQNSQSPSLITTNLHVGLFDGSGNELKRKLIFVENGVGQGDFAIDSTFTKSRYFIKAWTNWMKNFKNDNSYFEQIEVLDLSGGLETEITPSKEYSVEFFPEGGSVLADAENIIGIRLTGFEDKLLEKLQVRLLSDRGETLIDPVRLSKSGLGKFTYTQSRNRSYELHVSMDGQPMMKKALPQPDREGISLLVNSLHPSLVTIQVRTNERSLPQLFGKSLRLVVRGQDSTHLRQIGLSTVKQSISLEKSSLSKGVNHISLENGPGEILASRIFFNQTLADDEVLDVESRLNTSGDSVSFVLRIKRPLKENFSLSVAALPSGSRAYQPLQSIKSSFMLSPYLEEKKQELKSYLEGKGRRQEYELDILLLSERWPGNPSEMFYNPQISETNQWEAGITINGWAKNADLEREQSVWMYSGSIQNTFIGDLQKDKTFQTEAVLYENDSLAFTLIDKKGRMRQPDISFSLEPEKQPDRLNLQELDLPVKSSAIGEEQNWIIPFEISDQTIELDEVELVEQRIPTKFQINATTEMRRITDEDIKRRPAVIHYLRSLGFKVFINGTNFTVTRYLNPVLFRNLPVIVEGFRQTSTAVLQIPLSQVEFVTYDPLGFISISLKKYRYRGPDDEPLYIKFLIENGFARPSQFQVPSYSNFSNRFFKYYGVIDWQPMLVSDDQGIVSFKIPRLEQDEIILHIEGMGSEGTLISTSKTIRLVP